MLNFTLLLYFFKVIGSNGANVSLIVNISDPANEYQQGSLVSCRVFPFFKTNSALGIYLVSWRTLQSYMKHTQRTPKLRPTIWGSLLEN